MDKVEQTPEAGTPAAGEAKPEVVEKAAFEAVQSQLQTERLAREAAERSYTNLRRDHGRLGQEVGTYRKLYGGLGEDGAESGSRVQDAGEIAMPDPQEIKIDTIAFRQNTPDLDKRETLADGKNGPSIAEEMDALLKGEQRGDFAAFKPGSNGLVLDVEKTYRNAYRAVKLARMERSAAAVEAHKQNSEAQRAKLRGQAMISGTGAVEMPEGLDVANMTADEYLEKVLRPAGLVDERDPPRAMRRR